MKYSDNDLLNLISQVEEQFSDHLAKAEGIQENTSEQEDQENEINKSEEQDFSEDDELEEIENLYSSMSKTEAEAHLNALNSVLGTPMNKSEDQGEDFDSEEVDLDPEVINSINKSLDVHDDEIDMVKSELASQKEENQELRKSMAKITEIMTKMVKSSSQSKAVTGLNYIKKNEDANASEGNADVSSMTKSEITSKLLKKSRNPETSQSDRKLINDFYDNQVSVNDIQHLLV